MKAGILFVVFGRSFYNLAIKTIKHSRKFTGLPFFVITNIKNNDFKSIENTKYKYIDKPDALNRQYKTTMIDYSPFETTIYIDCDAVIQKGGIESVVELIEDNDILLNVYGTWTDQTKALSYYRITMENLKVKFPLVLYYGAFIVFKKTKQAYKFFKEWNKNWIKSGVKREMPALACTAKLNTETKIKKIMLKDGIFAWKPNEKAIIQHEYGNGQVFWDTFFRRVN